MSVHPLTVHNAKVHTAAVEIKTLTISGKQVTLAVFRQMPRDEFVMGQDTVWGTVNYCPDKLCRNMRAHTHFVFQRGDTLFRDYAVRPSGWHKCHGEDCQGPAYCKNKDICEDVYQDEKRLFSFIERQPQLYIAV